MRNIKGSSMKKGVTNTFIRWPGGKRWLVPMLLNVCPNDFETYYEPFLGGGSVYFALEPKRAVISDINAELINLYQIMRDSPQHLAELLLTHQQFHCMEYYYKVRRQIPADKASQAARTLYLNRTCYNGMYRVNKEGMFNVPIGTKTNCAYDIETFEEISKKLKVAQITCCDFKQNIRKAGKRDLLFVDPPYTVTKNQDAFIKYNQKIFDWEDQERLFVELNEAKKRGSYIILTNVKNKDIESMYNKAGYFVTTLERPSNIAGKVDKRGRVQELLITSFKWRDTSDKDCINK